jgi:hypothetical protein
METGKESKRMMVEGVERTGEGRVPFIGWDGALGGGNGRHRRTNTRPLMVFMAALTRRFNLQIKGEIMSGVVE